MATKIQRMRRVAEQAIARGEVDNGFRAHLAAGDDARKHERWLLAARCYRDALELDLSSQLAVKRLLAIGRHTKQRPVWLDYARMLDRDASWSQFSCRSAQLLVHNLGSVVQCSEVGPVLEVLLAPDGGFDCVPDARCRDMPLAMCLLILRRALWPRGRSKGGTRVRVGYRGHNVWLNSRGDWCAA